MLHNYSTHLIYIEAVQVSEVSSVKGQRGEGGRMPLGLDPRTFNTPPHSERLPQPNPRSQDELAKSLRQRCRAL